MALAAISNSLRSLKFTDTSHCASSFDPLHSISYSTCGCGSVKSEIPVDGYCLSAGWVSRNTFSPGVWPSSRFRRKAQCSVSHNPSSTPDSQTADNGTEEGGSVESHLDLLRKITSESTLGTTAMKKTIAQQLAEDLEAEDSEEATIPLGSGKLDIKASDLTISQKRNIRRQNYLNKVAERNDAPFFTVVALFVIVPPAAVLGVAVATGYVDLFP